MEETIIQKAVNQWNSIHSKLLSNEDVNLTQEYHNISGNDDDLVWNSSKIFQKIRN